MATATRPISKMTTLVQGSVCLYLFKSVSRRVKIGSSEYIKNTTYYTALYIGPVLWPIFNVGSVGGGRMADVVHSIVTL